MIKTPLVLSNGEKYETINSYRIICYKSFAHEVMAGYTPKTCRAINSLADKNTPYDLWH